MNSHAGRLFLNILGGAFSICVYAYSSPHVLAAEYDIHVIGSQGYEPQRPAINNLGQIAVLSRNSANTIFAKYEVGASDAPSDVMPIFPSGASLSDLGQLLGLVSSGSPLQYQLQLLSGNTLSTVGVVPSQLDYSSIIDHNSSGQFVGIHYQEFFSVVTTYVGSIGGSIADIGTLGGEFTLATDINEVGQTVGVSQTGATPIQINNGASVEEAFIYYNDNMRGLGTLGGLSSYAAAINDFGQVAGESSTTQGYSHAFLYSSQLGMQDIGTPNFASYALDLNNSSWVVGVELDGFGKMQAFVFDESRGMRRLIDLISPGTEWSELSQATSINNLGQIVGIGLYQGETRAFLLNPTPEPTTYLLFCSALVALSMLHPRGKLPRR